MNCRTRNKGTPEKKAERARKPIALQIIDNKVWIIFFPPTSTTFEKNWAKFWATSDLYAFSRIFFRLFSKQWKNASTHSKLYKNIKSAIKLFHRLFSHRQVCKYLSVCVCVLAIDQAYRRIHFKWVINFIHWLLLCNLWCRIRISF